MGRGLSPLQRAILRLARTNLEAEGREVGQSGWADVLHREIMVAFYGWPAPEVRDGDGLRARTGAELRHMGSGVTFHPAPAERGRYKASTVALTKATGRLEERGLVVCRTGVSSRWSGVSLTDAGLALAEEPDAQELEARRVEWQRRQGERERAAATLQALRLARR